jgi:hypothetical protein
VTTLLPIRIDLRAGLLGRRQAVIVPIILATPVIVFLRLQRAAAAAA